MPSSEGAELLTASRAELDTQLRFRLETVGVDFFYEAEPVVVWDGEETG